MQYKPLIRPSYHQQSTQTPGIKNRNDLIHFCMTKLKIEGSFLLTNSNFTTTLYENTLQKKKKKSYGITTVWIYPYQKTTNINQYRSKIYFTQFQALRSTFFYLFCIQLYKASLSVSADKTDQHLICASAQTKTPIILHSSSMSSLLLASPH